MEASIPGEVAMRLDDEAALENMIGMLHGGVATRLLDTDLGCAAHTMLRAGCGIVTVNLTVTFQRPATPGSPPILATGRVVNAGRRLLYVSSEVRDANEELVARAVRNLSIVGKPSAASATR